MGEWNANIKKIKVQDWEICKNTGKIYLTEMAKKMLNFCITNDTRMENTFYFQERKHKYTYIVKEGYRTILIDYMAFTNNLIYELQNLIMNKEAELNTKHRLIRA